MRRTGETSAACRDRSGCERGQALVEFALVVPILLVLALAAGDLGRVYTAIVALESGARAAADLGAFAPNNWNTDLSPSNPGQAVVKMEQMACSSAADSLLNDYAEPVGTLNHATCTNPAFACSLDATDGTATDCASYVGGSGGCGDPANDPPCVVHVTLTYTFVTFVQLPFLSSTTLTITRDARFAVSALSTGAP